MGSGATTPDLAGALRRAARALPAFVFVALVVAGCPPRQATLSISSAGVMTLVTACRACGPREDGGLEPICACTINGRPPPDLDRRGLQARLFLVPPADQT